MKQRTIILSLVWGFGLTLALSTLSRLAVQVAPYRDLPTMPKPFFLYALLPGIIVGEVFTPKWAQTLAFFFTNTGIYSIAVLSIRALARKYSRG